MKMLRVERAFLAIGKLCGIFVFFCAGNLDRNSETGSLGEMDKCAKEFSAIGTSPAVFGFLRSEWGCTAE
jgi:hypothetical protein